MQTAAYASVVIMWCVYDFAEKTLRQYCDFVGIDYQDSMVKWKPIPEDQMKQFTSHGDAFKVAREATTFFPHKPKARSATDDNVSEAVRDVISKAMPVYDMLKEAAKLQDPKVLQWPTWLESRVTE